MSWLNIEGKTVIVTGGSSGIGDAIVKELCLLQVNVVNADLSEGAFKHENLVFVQTDVTSRESVEAVVATALNHFGKIDGVVNNAGINIPALLVDEKQIENGKLVAQGHGVIINMSSESGLEGSEGQSAYAATKAAVNSYTRSWAKELGKKGIRVIGIAPGIMEETGLRTLAYEEALAYTRGKTVEELRAGYSQTSTIPLGRSGKLAEVADLVAYFLSERSSYISGVTVNVAGGKTRG
jgi:sorbitol-6-phosphate 2-dehydrogenase